VGSSSGQLHVRSGGLLWANCKLLPVADINLGLEWYDYGARYYDPAIGCFTGIDPIADQFRHVSPFNYAENEPIANIDLHGLQRIFYGEVLKNDAFEDV
jgi:RHS repeat-associated protein